MTIYLPPQVLEEKKYRAKNIKVFVDRGLPEGYEKLKLKPDDKIILERSFSRTCLDEFVHGVDVRTPLPLDRIYTLGRYKTEKEAEEMFSECVADLDRWHSLLIVPPKISSASYAKIINPEEMV